MKSGKFSTIHAAKLPTTASRRAVRKHLNVDTLLALVRRDCQMVPDARADNAKISLDDALMSALASFQQKDPSLLDFDKRRREEPDNLYTVSGITTIPCDSQIPTFSTLWTSLFSKQLSLSRRLYKKRNQNTISGRAFDHFSTISGLIPWKRFCAQ